MAGAYFEHPKTILFCKSPFLDSTHDGMRRASKQKSLGSLTELGSACASFVQYSAGIELCPTHQAGNQVDIPEPVHSACSRCLENIFAAVLDGTTEANTTPEDSRNVQPSHSNKGRDTHFWESPLGSQERP